MRAKEAKKILPKSEYEAFEAIFTNQISRTSSARLKQRATLSRRLRDKYRDMAHRMAAEVRDRRTNTTDTRLYERRASLFQDVIDRLEAELDRLKHQIQSGAAPKKKKASLAQKKEKLDKQDKLMKEARLRAR